MQVNELKARTADMEDHVVLDNCLRNQTWMQQVLSVCLSVSICLSVSVSDMEDHVVLDSLGAEGGPVCNYMSPNFDS